MHFVGLYFLTVQLAWDCAR